MFARILKSGTFHDVVGYVTRSTTPKNIRRTHGASSEAKIFSSPTMRKWLVQSFEAIHGFMPGKENPAGHISISFDTADAPRLTDEFMAQLAKEYMEGMGIKDTQYLIVRHLETGHNIRISISSITVWICQARQSTSATISGAATVL